MGEFKELLTSWRRTLHRYPETAFEEVKTAAFVAEKLKEMGIEVHTGIGGTGVVGVLKSGDSDRIIGLRADMDAISLTEANDFEYCSQVPGKMHGCGHDGHTTTLLGAAKLLAESKDFNGTVCFVFQPAEEPGKGAPAMLKDGFLERFPLQEFYGIHNEPTLPAHHVYTRVGGIMASEDNFTIKIHGKGGHASSPQNGVDPLVIASQIILALQTIVSRNVAPNEKAVVSCTEIFSDGGHNAIPSNVTILGDTRSTTPEIQKLIEERMREICIGTCEMNGASCEFTYTHEFRPTINDKKCTEYLMQSATKIVGSDHVIESKTWMGSEDFGAFLEQIPGAYFFLGGAVAENLSDRIPLHNSNFDYNDEILETGAKIYAQIVRDRMPL